MTQTRAARIWSTMSVTLVLLGLLALFLMFGPLGD